MRLHNFIAQTDTISGEQCDHINHQVLDCRLCNLRNGTNLQNLCNTEKGIGQVKQDKDTYRIEFPSDIDLDSTPYSFSSFSDAEHMKNTMLSGHPLYHEWTLDNSRKIAEENESYEFVHDELVDAWASSGTMGAVMSLPPNNVLNARLRDLKVEINSERITPDEEWRIQQDIAYDYHQMTKFQ